MKSVRRAATEDHSREDAEGAGRLPAQRRQAGEDDEEGEGSVQRRRAGVPGCVRALRLRRFGGAKAGCARLVLLAACCAQTVRAGLFQFMTRHNSTKAAAAAAVLWPQHFEKKLQGQIAPNVTTVKEAWYSQDQKRWYGTAGADIDGMLKDDGPNQLTNAIWVLCAVAGTVICGGCIGIVCLWVNRERGWSSAAKIKKLKSSGGDYSNIENVKDPFQGGGAEWLKNPV